MTRRFRFALAGCVLLALAPFAASGQEAAPAPAAPAGDGLMSRIDFGNAYVMGQSIQSGAVYLLNRKQSDIASMLSVRESFRQEIREDAERIGAPPSRTAPRP